MTWSVDIPGRVWRNGDYSLVCGVDCVTTWSEAGKRWQLMHFPGDVVVVVSECQTGAGPEGVRMARDWADGLIAERAL